MQFKGYIFNLVTDRATGAHWNLPGHSLVNLKVIILEQTKRNNEGHCRDVKNIKQESWTPLKGLLLKKLIYGGI